MVNLSLKQRIPPLENGDHLTHYEFERRYQAMPRHQKAELIEGVVYFASPLRFESHAEPHGHVIGWLGVYQALTPGVRLGIEPTVRLNRDNELQPDGVLLITPTAKGNLLIHREHGAPDAVILGPCLFDF